MDIFAWLSQLIALDTTSRHSNLELITLIQSFLLKQGWMIRITRDAHEQKANLFATLPGRHGGMEGGLILSGHTDVVPVEGQKWQTNPFAALRLDDRIYGRGTCDMKGFLAVILALAPAFQKLTLHKPLHLAFSYDEEVGCRGAPLLIDDLQKAGIKPGACIVGEPTSLHPVVAHKGIQGFKCTVKGHAMHSSLTPEGCNAIEYAAQLIGYIRHLADEFRQKGPFDLHYDVPFTTISTNKITGGNAVNTIPASCEFIFEFRNLPEIKPQDVKDKILSYIQNELQVHMQRENKDTSITLQSFAAVPYFEADKNSLIYDLAYKLSGVKEIRKVAYATEAGQFQAAGIPTIVCGPGSIEQAHGPDEFVSVEDLYKCEKFLREVVSEFCGVEK